MVNKLPTDKRKTILNMLVEGSSMRATSRITGADKNTVAKLLRDAGEACQAFHDHFVYDIQSQRLECDEIWSFNYAKDKNVARAKSAPENAGSVWTWTALDPDSKMIVAWHVGTRGQESADSFMRNVYSRLADRVQLTTDGHLPYLTAVERVFGADVDFGQLVKEYREDRYHGSKKYAITGEPAKEYLSTSLVERQNLTMRMSMRRFTRKTNAHSKKFEMHCNALALYFVWYNFVRPHGSLAGRTPAMAAGLVDEALSFEWIVGMVDALAPKPNRPKTYKKKERKDLTATSLG